MIEINKIRVTPELANLWLGKNTQNRKISKASVDMIVRDIETNNWQDNGDTIKRSEDGTLYDGQHRLSAVAQSGISVDMIVVSNIPISAKDTINTGQKITNTQFLVMKGYSYSSIVAAGASFIYEYKNNKTKTKGKIPARDLARIAETHPLLIHFVSRFGIEEKIRQVLSSRGSGVMTLAAEKYGQFKIDQFLDSVKDGIGLEKGQPTYELRERLLNSKDSNRVIVGLTIKALNAYCSGLNVKRLRFGENDQMPLI